MHRQSLSLPQRLVGVTRSAPSVVTDAQATLVERTRAAKEAADAQALGGMLQSLAVIVDDARRKGHGAIADLAQQSVELGVAIAERLLASGIALDRQRLDQIVLTSLERLPSANKVILRAHPDDIALLHRQIDNNALLERWRETLTFQQDQTCARGRLILEADDLFVEWDTQRSLAEMRGLLLDQIFTEA